MLFTDRIVYHANGGESFLLLRTCWMYIYCICSVPIDKGIFNYAMLLALIVYCRTNSEFAKQTEWGEIFHAKFSEWIECIYFHCRGTWLSVSVVYVLKRGQLQAVNDSIFPGPNYMCQECEYTRLFPVHSCMRIYHLSGLRRGMNLFLPIIDYSASLIYYSPQFLF